MFRNSSLAGQYELVSLQALRATNAIVRGLIVSCSTRVSRDHEAHVRGLGREIYPFLLACGRLAGSTLNAGASPDACLLARTGGRLNSKQFASLAPQQSQLPLP